MSRKGKTLAAVLGTAAAVVLLETFAPQMRESISNLTSWWNGDLETSKPVETDTTPSDANDERRAHRAQQVWREFDEGMRKLRARQPDPFMNTVATLEQDEAADLKHAKRRRAFAKSTLVIAARNIRSIHGPGAASSHVDVNRRHAPLPLTHSDSRPLRNILSFLDVQCVAQLISTHSRLKSVASELLSDRWYLRQCAFAGFSPKLRSNIWLHLSGALSVSSVHIHHYSALRNEVNHQTAEFTHSIRQDIRRTFPEHEFFKNGPGYVQGMNFLTGFLMLQFANQHDSQAITLSSAESIKVEEHVFWTLVCLFHRYNMTGCFSVGLPLLQLCMAQWEELFTLYFPELAHKFTSMGLHGSMYASEWFLTLFCYRLPLNACLRVWDLFFVDGLAAIHRVGLALMSLYQEQLMDMSFEDTLHVLKSFPDPALLRAHMSVSSSQIDLDDEYHSHVESLRSKHASNSGSVAHQESGPDVEVLFERVRQFEMVTNATLPQCFQPPADME